MIKELDHAHIGVTATVYAHVRLRLQRDAIDTLSTALDSRPASRQLGTTAMYHRPALLSSVDVAVNYCRHRWTSPARCHLTGLTFARATT